MRFTNIAVTLQLAYVFYVTLEIIIGHIRRNVKDPIDYAWLFREAVKKEAEEKMKLTLVPLKETSSQSS